MNIKLLAIGLVLAVLVVSGCIEKEPTVETYRCETGSSMYLKSDGAYIMDSIYSHAFFGNYTILDNKMFLNHMVFGTSVCIKFFQCGENFTDEDGDRWVIERT